MLIKVYILLTLIFYFFYNKNKQLLIILLLGVLNSLISTVLLYFYNDDNSSISLNTNIYIILHTVVWLTILCRFSYHKKIVVAGFALFILLSVANFARAEGIGYINHSFAFIAGALIYVSVFLFECFYQLKDENLVFFTRNEFILIFSPILFFIGMSLLFAFNNRNLNDTKIFGIGLYIIVSTFVNFIYYTLINVFIYKKIKAKNA